MDNKPKIKNGILSFKQEGFSGGRQKVDGDGYVVVEFWFDESNKEIFIDTFDKLNTEDGHYAPLGIDLNGAIVLKSWLDSKIKLMSGV